MGGIFIWNGTDDPEQLKDCYIYNNTTYNAHGGALCYEPMSRNKGFQFYNNIFVGKDDLIKGMITSGIFQANNWYSLDSGFNFGGIRSFSSWVKQSGNEYRDGVMTGMNIDPLFENPGETKLTDPYQLKDYNNYRIPAGSPLSEKGMILPESFGKDANSKDISGKLAGEGLIGAYQPD